MQRFFAYATTLGTGTPVPFATINVYTAGTTTPATIYIDNLSDAGANPFNADQNGYLYFYAANGRYDVNISNPTGIAAGQPPIPVPYTWGDVVLNDVFSLNGQTGNVQTMVVGTAGADFNIADVSNVHTFNLPDASATHRGAVTTGTQTFAGAKTFSTPIAVGSGGTGISTTPSNGFIPIGNGTNYTAAAITGTANQITVTNGSGTITLSAAQSIATGSSPTFTGLTLSGLTNYQTVTTGAFGVLTTAGAATNGQVLIGSTGVAPVLATLIAGTNVTITNGAGSITINAAGGINSLNGLTGVTQTFATATTGSNFTITSTGTTHTFAIPDAGTAARGFMNSGSQSFGGQKTFDRPPEFAPVSGATATIVAANGVMYVTGTSVTSIAATETDLITFSVPTGAFSVNGSWIRMTAAGTSANNAHTKTLKVYGGGTSVSFTLVPSGIRNWLIEAWYVQQNTGGPTAFMFARLTVGTLTSTLAAAITITSGIMKITGTASANSDITCYGGFHEWVGN